jgi:hypothetical protein
MIRGQVATRCRVHVVRGAADENIEAIAAISGMKLADGLLLGSDKDRIEDRL